MLVNNLANFNQIFKLTIIISTVVVSVTAYNKKPLKSSNIKYHIKWIFNDYAFPIYLGKKIDNSIDADYKWYRHTDNLFVDEIENYEKYFLYSSTHDTTNLYILNYNFQTHDQLASYEPKIIAVRTDSNDETELEHNLDELNKNREIFTLSYLKSQSILIEDKKGSSKIEYSCSVIVLLPLNEYQSDLRTEYNNLLQNYIYIKMVVSSDDDADFLNVKNDHNNKHPHRPHKVHTAHKRDTESKQTFLEIEIREGPISVYRSLKGPRRDNISCYLKLTDSDDDTYSRYQKTIYKNHVTTNEQHTTRFKAIYPTKKIPLSTGTSLFECNNISYYSSYLISILNLVFLIHFQ